MTGTLFGSTREQAAAVRAAARASAAAFVAEQKALHALWLAAAPEQREFVAGEVACLLHVSPRTGADRVGTALRLVGLPRLLSAVEVGLLAVPHALALLAEVEHLAAPHAAAVLADVLDGPLDADGRLDATPSQLRASARRAAITVDPDAARRRHDVARATAGARLRPQPDGMADLVLGCTAVEGASVLAALRGRAAAMTFTEDLTEGQKQIAALLHALGCERVQVQAVVECPVERAVDLHALSGVAAWTVDVRMPAAVALGLSDHPALLAGYGPIGADQARALLPQADLVKACVDASTGEVLAVEQGVRWRTWARGWAGRTGTGRAAPGRAAPRDGAAPGGQLPERADRSSPSAAPSRPEDRPAASDRAPTGDSPSDRALALRAALIEMATTASALPDLTSDRYVPSAALGRLVDLRDVTSVFPGDGTPARRSDRDHRLPWPLGHTEPDNLQSLSKHWHRAKHEGGWTSRLLDDGTVRWTSPGGGTYDRRPVRTPPPPVPAGSTLPPLTNP